MTEKNLKKEVKLKIDEETAAVEFDRFIEEMGLYFETEDMDAEELSDFNKQKGKLLRAIQTGSLSINENGEAVYSPCNKNSKSSNAITFHERTGASLMATDRSKKGHDATKMYAMMGDMCRVHQNVFAGLAGSDIKVCEAIFGFLMD